MWKNVTPLAGCHLTTDPKSRSCGKQETLSFDIPSVCPGTSQYPSCLCLEEVPLFVRLDGEHPSSGYIIPWFDLPQINMNENFIVNQGFVLQVFGISKLFVISSHFLSWVFLSCTGSPFCLDSSCLSASRHTLFQHISSSTVNSFCNSNLYATEVIGHLIEVPWSLISNFCRNEKNYPAAAACLCVSGVSVQCSSSART